MRDKKVISTVVNQKDNVATVQPVRDDPTTVQVNGREAGSTRVTLVAADRTEENYEVLVQLDLDFLRSILQRAAPTASLELTPAPNNTVIIAGTVAHAEDIDVILRTAASVAGDPGHVINAMHVGGVMAVQLDVVIAQVSRSDLRTMSFEFLSQGLHHSLVSTFSGPANPSLVPPTAVGGAAGATFTPPAIGTSANAVLGLFDPREGQQFLSFLQALRQENVSKLLAEPHLIALSGHSAFFNSGGQQAVPQVSGGSSAATAGVNFIPFGTQLSFLPIVMGNGKIYLEVEPDVSNPSNNPLLAAPIPGATGTVAGRTGQRVRTSVVMEDGQTLVIGGLIQHEVSAEINKVPVLGDCPFIGTLFSTKSYNDSEEELVIVVTPHLVDPMSCDQKCGLLPGQETRRPDDFELFLEGILEAPRGPREVFQGRHYVPAYKNAPGAEVDPSDGPGGACPAGCKAGTAETLAPDQAMPVGPRSGPAGEPVNRPAANRSVDLLPSAGPAEPPPDPPPTARAQLAAGSGVSVLSGGSPSTPGH